LPSIITAFSDQLSRPLAIGHDLSKAPDFQPKIAVANILNFERARAASGPRLLGHKHANTNSALLAQCRAVRILKKGAWNVL
jgi:hypothetical protein